MIGNRRKVTAVLLCFVLAVTMLPAMAFAGSITADNVKHAEEDPSSYGYDEKAAESVTVTVTLSNDGKPIQGRDEGKTAISHLEVTVPYFDLELYDLTEYYRYDTNGTNGRYPGDTEVVERPTMLHLYIYIAERYYLGLPEEECGLGNDYSHVIDYVDETQVYYFDGEEAYNSVGDWSQYKAFGIGGGAMSLYINGGMFGHDENLMYYRNHRYPLMEGGTGATADYCLLSDGDDIDVAMFSNWDFYSAGKFLAFGRELYEAEPGQRLTIPVYETGTTAVDGGETPVTACDGSFELDVALYDDTWKIVEDVEIIDQDDGTYEILFPEEAGTYYLMAMDVLNGQLYEACQAPATAKVIIGEDSIDDGAAALAEAKTEAKEELAGYKDAGAYREAQKTELAEAVASGNAAIDRAANTDEVAAALAAAKTEIDKIKTDAQLTAEEEAAALAEAKTEAKEELAGYKDAGAYREAQKTELAEAVASGNAAIDRAANTDEVAAALATAKTEIDKIKTDAQLTAEEEAAALAQAKTEAKEELAGYKDAGAYREAQKTELAEAVASGNAAIDRAANTDEVAAALAAAKTEIDKIKTDAQLTAEEEAAALAEAKNAAKEELAGYKDADDYREAQKTELAEAVASGNAAIDRAANTDEVAAALAAAKTEIDKIKTDAQLTAEEEQLKEEQQGNQEQDEQPLETENPDIIKGADTNADAPVQPETGDETEMFIYLAAAVLAGAAMIGLRRKEY